MIYQVLILFFGKLVNVLAEKRIINEKDIKYLLGIDDKLKLLKQ